MSQIIRYYDPFRELRRFMMSGLPMTEDADLLSDSNSVLAVDMYSDDQNNFVVKADLPGVEPEDVDITVTADTLTIKAERNEVEEVKEENAVRKERRFGSVSRTLTFSAPVIASEAQADFKNGTLVLTIPKQVASEPELVKVRVNGSNGSGKEK